MADRDHDGRFKKGNKAARGGNPHTAKLNQYRRLFYEVVTEDDMKEIIKKMLTSAKQGEQWAIKEALDRALGKATQPVEGDVNAITEVIVRYENNLPTE